MLAALRGSVPAKKYDEWRIYIFSHCRKLSQNILDISAVILPCRHHLEPEFAQERLCILPGCTKGPLASVPSRGFPFASLADPRRVRTKKRGQNLTGVWLSLDRKPTWLGSENVFSCLVSNGDKNSSLWGKSVVESCVTQFHRISVFAWLL